MNRRSFFKFLPAMPVAAVAASKAMADPSKIEPYIDPKALAEYTSRDWKIDNWTTGSWKKITPNPDLGKYIDLVRRVIP